MMVIPRRLADLHQRSQANIHMQVAEAINIMESLVMPAQVSTKILLLPHQVLRIVHRALCMSNCTHIVHLAPYGAAA